MGPAGGSRHRQGRISLRHRRRHEHHLARKLRREVTAWPVFVGGTRLSIINSVSRWLLWFIIVVDFAQATSPKRQVADGHGFCTPDSGCKHKMLPLWQVCDRIGAEMSPIVKSAFLGLGLAAALFGTDGPVTFNRDVLPILQ